jgi:hypothetical protein
MSSTTLRDLFGTNLIPKSLIQKKAVPVGAGVSRVDERNRSDPGVSAAIGGLRGDKRSDERSRVIARCEHSLEAFCLEYLPHHFTEGFCEVHEDIFEACDAPAPETGKRVVRAAPRKFGKTTIIALGKPLHELAYQRKKFILLIGETATTAEANLGTLTAEVENNERLRADFPHFAPAKDNKGQPVKWTDKQIVFSDFSTVMAKGLGARSRGIKYRQNRPDLAILDDPESPETADTFLKRLRHKRWFGGTFMGLGATNWDLFVIGNLIHNDCLLASLLRDKTWDSLLWRAKHIIKDEERYPTGHTLNDGSAVWPEVWSLERLEAFKNTPEVGEFNFAREMMNDPKTKEEQQFDPSEFTYYVHEDTRTLRYRRKLTYVDPAGGDKPGEMKKGRRDYCAIVTGGVSPEDGWVEIFDVELIRLTPDKQIDRVLDIYAKLQAPIQVEEVVYKNLYASAMAKSAKERGLFPAITTRDVHGQRKDGRILGTQPKIMHKQTRHVRFAQHLIDQVPDYFAQFEEYPGEYDDGPDATEGVIHGLETGVVPKTILSSTLTKPSNWRNQ